MSDATRRMIPIAVAAIAWTALLWLVRPMGTFNIDEVHYLLAAERFAHSASMVIPNGYGFFPDDLLLFMHPQPIGSLPTQPELTTFIPPLYAPIAAPFYLLAGLSGLFLLNAIGHIVALVLAGWIAGRTANEADSAFNAKAAWAAAIVLGVGSYMADYAISVVNHMLNLALVLGAVALHPAFAREGSRAHHARALACGLLIGVACGVRLQSVVVAGALGLFLLDRNAAARGRVALYALGLAIPLAVSAAMNHARFGIASPFTYGTGVQEARLPVIGPLLATAWGLPALALLALAIVLALLPAWGCALPVLASRIAARRRLWIGVTAAIALLPCVLYAPRFCERVLGVAFGIDAPNWLSTAGIEWHVGTRKAWLQSFPLCLAAIALPFLLASQAGALTQRRALLAAAMWLNVEFVVALKNNGGFFMNQRYLVEATALAAILLGSVAPELFARLDRRFVIGGAALGVGYALAAMQLGKPGGPPEMPTQFFDRIAPLLLGLAGSAALLWAARATEGARVPGRALSLAIVPAVCLPLFLHLWSDADYVHKYRASMQNAFEAVEKVVPDGSLLIVHGAQREGAGRLKETRDVWVADALRTEKKGTMRLLAESRDNGWRSHWFLARSATTPEEFRALTREWNATVVIEQPFTLFELKPKSASAAP